jgi:hypothetical protein
LIAARHLLRWRFVSSHVSVSDDTSPPTTLDDAIESIADESGGLQRALF